MNSLEKMKIKLNELFRKAQSEKRKEKQRELYGAYQQLYRLYQMQRVMCEECDVRAKMSARAGFCTST